MCCLCEEESRKLFPEWQSKSLAAIIAERVRKWWTSLDTPDPWSADLDAAARAATAIPICHHCTTPCELPVWFCPACGAVVGPYNNIMPYIYIFSIGEALRSGVGPEAHFTPFRTVAYVCLGLAEYQLFAPLYFVRLYRNHRRLEEEQAESPGSITEPVPGPGER